MTRRRILGKLGILAAVTAAELVAMPNASAHTHPTPTEKAAPAVVFVETRARVDIALIEHNRLGRHIGLVQRTYSPVLAAGSGFAVDPSGVIVTSGAIISPDMAPAEVYAVNQLFHDRYGANAPIPADPFTQHRIPDIADDPVGSRLSVCYIPNTTNGDGGCVVKVTPEYRVYPYVSSQQKFGDLSADLISPRPGSTADVALLRIGASSMPTVNLGQSVAGAEAISVLGFTSVPTAAHPLVQIDAHLVQKGATTIRPADFTPKLINGLRAGVRGGPVVAEGGQVIGFMSSPLQGAGQAQTGSPTLVTASAIQSALQKALVTPHRGPVDVDFEAAMHNFKNAGFAASIPSFQDALSLYPGHFLASTNLEIAKAKQGTTPTAGSTQTTAVAPSGRKSSTAWVWSLIVLALLAALVLGTLLLVRRRRRRPYDAGAGESGKAPVPPDRPLPPAAAARAQESVIAKPPPRTGQPTGVASDKPAATSTGRAGPTAQRLPAGKEQPASAVAAPPAQGSRVAARPREMSMMPSPSVTNTNVAASARSQQAPIFCTSCGGRLAAHHRFCGWCGEPVG
jgi:hypothetical protein